VIFVVCSSLILCLASACRPSLESLGKERKALADRWGVNVEDYGMYFLLDYFRDKLHEGMPIDEVHAVMKAYERVFHCGYDAEIYYYYSSDDNLALRIEVLYEPDGLIFLDVIGEDWEDGGLRQFPSPTRVERQR
jgi:hypothetical protein